MFMASNEIIFIDNKFRNVKKSLQQHNTQKWHCSLLYVSVLITWHVLNVQCYMSLESQFSDLCDANKITKVRFSSEEYQLYNSRQWFTLSWTSRKWKCIYMFLKSSSLLPGIDQTNQVCSNDDQERVYQNPTFYDLRGRGSFARAWPYNSYSENVLFL